MTGPVIDNKDIYVAPIDQVGIPFDTAEDAWFWFIMAQQARNDGARFVSGIGTIQRPCEPLDILKIMDDLYRQRRLQRKHFLVLRHYGRRNLAPDQRRVKEAISHQIWEEALERMEPVLVRKGIIKIQSWVNKYQTTDGNDFQDSLFADQSIFGSNEVGVQ